MPGAGLGESAVFGGGWHRLGVPPCWLAVVPHQEPDHKSDRPRL